MRLDDLAAREALAAPSARPVRAAKHRCWLGSRQSLSPR
ncbi:hypothetical protein trd_A0119 (plasmid) [Thermomicrobium roseum DSM 5159]|uniref:Uncharacterized protein n=1 Tax=Thermomicrobium roseum (strain ATCC 27502 / DSM 5159 / P-2) TaxID=309801 RepID=B9L2V5_THERP|nr:hypothetical protein trd_A0119 [Thermomicrobium roseum DSM 5159]